MTPRADTAIREASAADFAAFAPIMVAAIRTHGRHAYTVQECEAWAKGVRTDLFRRGAAEGQIFRTIGPPGQPVAFASHRGRMLVGLYVAPDAMGRGHGSTLLAEMERLMRAEEPADAPLHLTAALNTRDFYRKRGWTDVMEKRHPTRGGIDITVCDMIKA